MLAIFLTKERFKKLTFCLQHVIVISSLWSQLCLTGQELTQSPMQGWPEMNTEHHPTRLAEKKYLVYTKYQKR